MIGGFKNVNLAWIMRMDVICYTWLFIYQRAYRYEGGMHVPPGFWFSVDVVSVWLECQSPVVDHFECGGRVGVGYGCVTEYCSGVFSVFEGLGCD